ncbi:MAG: single hybrid motif-containing protein [Monoraphidium minutum]|nr:MAG: single hybrid motif-containing protein [Monoraphidium minutum]
MLAARALARALRAGAGPAGAAPWAAYSTQVRVPPLGDSISEGSISAVLKQAGEMVKENEVIAQIETDKVTIDIKAPQAGTLVGILVKQDDTVTPGQLIATVDEKSAASAGALFGGAPAAAPAAAAPAAAGAPAAASGGGGARRPGISFPPRVTPEGVRISSLPAAEAAAWAQRLGGGAAPAPAAPAAVGARAAPPPPPPVSAAAAAVGKTARAKVVTTRLKEQPARTRMTDKELDAIMLGGAID